MQDTTENAHNAKAIKRYIKQYGFGLATLPLTRTLSAEDFRQHYYDKQELIQFCTESSFS